MTREVIYSVEVSPYGNDDESTATRRRWRNIAAANAMQAVEAVIAADRTRLVAATVLPNDRASGVAESADDQHTTYRIYAFPIPRDSSAT